MYLQGIYMSFNKENQMIEKYNNIFQQQNLNIRITNWNSQEILLNVGYSLTLKSERRKFRTRCNSPFLLPHIDAIYINNDISTRNCLVREIANRVSSYNNKLHWKKLDILQKQKKIKHMQQIQLLVDRKNIKHGIPWNKGKTKLNDNRLAHNSRMRTGKGNPMFGQKMSEQDKLIKSNLTKQRILDGKWTPHVHNSRTHWQCEYNGKKYRSSWEAMYAYMNVQDEYEKLRIKYFLGQPAIEYIYIVDFVNHSNKTLTEIKPTEHAKDEKFIAKCNAAINWCTNNGYIFRVVTQQYFIDNFTKIDFDKLAIPKLKQKIARIKYEANIQNRNS